jgi:hypothetical protein
MIRALPCTSSVITPAWEPVYERALRPRLAIAIANSAIEIRSPAVSSMSSSRAGGSGLTRLARSSRSSVVSPIAETTTTTEWPALRLATIRCATRLMPSASATDDPPYFCTTSATGASLLPLAAAGGLSVPTSLGELLRVSHPRGPAPGHHRRPSSPAAPAATSYHGSWS